MSLFAIYIESSTLVIQRDQAFIEELNNKDIKLEEIDFTHTFGNTTGYSHFGKEPLLIEGLEKTPLVNTLKKVILDASGVS